MERVLRIQQLLLRSKRLPWLVTGATLVVLAGAILATTQQLRHKLRAQIIGRDGSILHAVALMQLQEGNAKSGTDAASLLDDAAGQFELLMQISRLSGVLGARLFDPAGRFVAAFPAHVLEAELDPASLAAARAFQPASQFRPAVRLAEVFLPWKTNQVEIEGSQALLMVSLPLHQPGQERLAGIGQFIIEGHSIAAEFATLDHRLFLQAGVAFLVSGGILVTVIAWSFRRLRRAHQLLAARTHSLLRANQELALAAKTSALGTLTAHLIHGLSNPLSGLQSFMASRGCGTQAANETEWQEALQSTRRMQGLIGEIVRLLAAENGSAEYEISLVELVEVVLAKTWSTANDTGVRLESNLAALPGIALPNRQANLVILILENLVLNAIQASRPGQHVRLSITPVVKGMLCRVQDEGPGLPEHLVPKIFMPCRSSKPNGNGIGLAISKQLANHLGAVLELESSTSAGCVFDLWLPEDLWASAAEIQLDARTQDVPEARHP